jgi:glycosyltransferase involved in cell wall biosynthesis
MEQKKIHIVHVMANNSSVPYFNWYAEMAKHEPSVKLSFVVLLNETPQMIDDMKGTGCEVHHIFFNSSKRKTSFLKAIPKLRRLFRKISPDVVHTHLFDDSVPALAAARLAGVPVRVITKGDTGFHWHFAPKGIKMDKLNNANATHIIALSSESRIFIIEKEKTPPGKVYVIPHGIPIAQFSEQHEASRKKLRERFGISNGQFVVGTVSRFIAWKGYREIVLAAELIVKEFPQLHFLFAGRGEQLEEIRALITQKKLSDHITITGWIDREDMPSFYGIMDTYLHAATLEPFGFVIAEAMANRLPVISVNTGAARDGIVNDTSGLLLEKAEPELIAAALRKMITMSAEKRMEMGENARRSAEKLFSMERVWRDLLELYRKGSEN